MKGEECVRTLAIVQIEDALVRVFGEQRVQHVAGLSAVSGEYVALPDVIGPLAPGERPGVEGHVADEVEGVEVLGQFSGDQIERQALGRQLLDDRLLALGGLPAPEEVVEAGEALFQRSLGEVAQGLGDELAVLVQILDPIGDDRCADAVHVDFLPPAVLRGRSGVGRVVDDGLILFRLRLFGIFGRGHGVVLAGLVYLHRLAVELRIREMAGCAAKVHQREIEFSGVLVDAGAASDNLLELGHGADLAVEDDEPAGLNVDAGGEQPRGGDQHGVSGFRVDEVAELRLPFGIAAGDAHDVAVVTVHEVGVLVDEGLAHAGGVLPIHAENDGLLKGIAGFGQEPGDLAGDELGPFVQHEVAVEIPGVVDAILDLHAVAIQLPFLGAVALHVAVDVDPDDLVGGEEAVLNALLEGVGVNGRAEVMDVGDVARLPGRGREADLRGGGEVVQNLAPGGIIGGAAAMALVDHDEIEETGRKLAKNLLVLLRPGDRLIEAEIDFIGGVHVALRKLGHDVAEGLEVVDSGLVDQDVAIREEQDALLAARLPQPPDDLKGGVGLARSRGHDEQDAVAALGDGLDGGVDGIGLIVAWGFAAAVVVIILEDNGLGFGRQALPCAVARPQVARRREGVVIEGGLLFGARARAVVEDEAVAVGGKHEGDVEGLGVAQSLLHAAAHGVGVVLGFDERDGDVGLVMEDVVGPLALSAADQPAAHGDAALGEAHLLADLRHLVPPGLAQGGRDELGADVAFGEAFLVHAVNLPPVGRSCDGGACGVDRQALWNHQPARRGGGFHFPG